MSASCAGCGDCCQILNIHGEVRPPRLPGDSLYGYDPGELLQRYHWTVDQVVYAYERDFLRGHWHDLPYHVVLQIAPDMARRIGAFYWCDQYDADTKQCKAHELKPSVCSGYPWYGGMPGVAVSSTGDRYPHILDSPRCSYWHDIPADYWPAGTDPLPSPAETPDVPYRRGKLVSIC